jgi:hypothetical protein
MGCNLWILFLQGSQVMVLAMVASIYLSGR